MGDRALSVAARSAYYGAIVLSNPTKNSVRFVVAGVLCSALAGMPARAHAQTPDPQGPSAPFVAGYRGLLVGAALGVSVGYLVARRGGWEREDWRPLFYGAGVGSLAGAALGLGLGIADLAGNTYGGPVALQTTLYGAGFGAAAGGIGGALAAASTRRAEHVFLGAAIGSLSGGAIGLALGLFEGYRPRRDVRIGFSPVFAPAPAGAVPASPGGMAAAGWLTELSGRF